MPGKKPYPKQRPSRGNPKLRVEGFARPSESVGLPEGEESQEFYDGSRGTRPIAWDDIQSILGAAPEVVMSWARGFDERVGKSMTDIGYVTPADPWDPRSTPRINGALMTTDALAGLGIGEVLGGLARGTMAARAATKAPSLNFDPKIYPAIKAVAKSVSQGITNPELQTIYGRDPHKLGVLARLGFGKAGRARKLKSQAALDKAAKDSAQAHQDRLTDEVLNDDSWRPPMVGTRVRMEKMLAEADSQNITNGKAQMQLWESMEDSAKLDNLPVLPDRNLRTESHISRQPKRAGSAPPLPPVTEPWQTTPAAARVREMRHEMRGRRSRISALAGPPKTPEVIAREAAASAHDRDVRSFLQAEAQAGRTVPDGIYDRLVAGGPKAIRREKAIRAGQPSNEEIMRKYGLEPSDFKPGADIDSWAETVHKYPNLVNYKGELTEAAVRKATKNQRLREEVNYFLNSKEVEDLDFPEGSVEKLFDLGRPGLKEARRRAKAGDKVLFAKSGGAAAPIIHRSLLEHIPGPASGVPQVPIVRTRTKKGPGEELQRLMENPDVIRSVEESAHRGMRDSGGQYYATTGLRNVFDDVWHDQSRQKYRLWNGIQAATSPRSDVPQNQRIASEYWRLLHQGEQLPMPQPHRAKPSLIPQIAEGFGSIAQRLHAMNVQKVIAAGGPDFTTGSGPYRGLWKPPSYGHNLDGNWATRAVDTHDIKNATIPTRDPRFLSKSYSEEFLIKNADGSQKLTKKGKPVKGKRVLLPQELYASGKISMDDAVARPGFWRSAPTAHEYGAFEDFMNEQASKMSLPVAQHQAAVWEGGRKMTGLTTPPGTFQTLLEKNIHQAAQFQGVTPTQMLIDMVSGKRNLRYKESFSAGIPASIAMREGAYAKSGGAALPAEARGKGRKEKGHRAMIAEMARNMAK